MKIVISIPVHERKDVVLDQVRNIQCYIDHPIIVLHISKKFFEEEKGCFEEIKRLENVYINPVHYEVGWGNIAHIHISNFNFIKKVVVNFDYFIIHASNDMYIKKGIENYICHFDAGIQRRILRHKKTMWCPCEYAWRDETLKEIMGRCCAEFPVGTQIEGSFFRKEFFAEIVENIGDSKFWDGENYTREEIYFSTVAYNMVEEARLGYPTTFSEVHRHDRGMWIRERMLYSFSILPFIKNIASGNQYEQLRRKMILRYEEKADYAISKKDIKRIRKFGKLFFFNNTMKDYPGKYKLYDGNIYSVKRIPREIDDPLRTYLRRKMNEDIMS